MRIFLLAFLSLGPLLAFCQDTTEFNFTGQVMSHDSVPLENAYLINYRTYNVYATNKYGKVTIPVQQGDSMVVSYISYLRKIIHLDSLNNNRVIYLEIDTIFIGQVNVFQNQVDEIENMRKNLKLFDYTKLPEPTEEYTEQERITEFITANNRILKTDAGLLKIYKFSPSAVIGGLFKKKKNKKNSKKITSTKKKK